MRSRLEARVAETFDKAGVRWAYECESFDLGGVNYLPDFYLYDIKWFVEVKGVIDDSVSKPAALARALYARGIRVALVTSSLHCFAFDAIGELSQHGDNLLALKQELNPVVSRISIDASLKSAHKKLTTRRDSRSLRDAELLRRVIRGDFLTDNTGEDRKTALVYAAIAVVRSVPTGTTEEQIRACLSASAGVHAEDLPEVVGLAVEHSRQLPSIFARQPGFDCSTDYAEEPPQPDPAFAAALADLAWVLRRSRR